MPRRDARLTPATLEELRGLSIDAKLLYLALLTEPTVNTAGVGVLRISLWSRKIGIAPGACSAALAELAAREHVTVDYETEEFIIETFIVGQGISLEPNKLKGAIDLGEYIFSQIIRDRLGAILDSLGATVRERPRISAARRQFKCSSARKRLRTDIDAGLHTCAECGESEITELVVDHITPLAAGGGNDPDNLQVLCTTCNGRKGARV